MIPAALAQSLAECAGRLTLFIPLKNHWSLVPYVHAWENKISLRGKYQKPDMESHSGGLYLIPNGSIYAGFFEYSFQVFDN